MDGLPPGKYVIHPHVPEGLPFAVAEFPAVEVKPGAQVTVSLSLARAVRVQGTIVDKNSGTGLEDVRVSFGAYDSEGQFLNWTSAITGDRGAYALYVKPGKIRASVRVPEGYVRPDRSQLPGPDDVSEATTWPRIELEPMPVVKGMVVDESGKPLPDAEILVSSGRHSPGFQRRSRSDDEGRFTLKIEEPAEPLHVLVRSETAVSDGVVVITPAEIEGPMIVAVSEKRTFTLQGRLVDEAGGPVAGAVVRLTVRYGPGDGSSHPLRLPPSATDDKGRFEFRALWPSYEYYVDVEHEGHDKYRSKSVAETAGATHDFGDLVLTRAQGVIEGAVVDSDGNPLEGVHVFNVGDAPRPLATRGRKREPRDGQDTGAG